MLRGGNMSVASWLKGLGGWFCGCVLVTAVVQMPAVAQPVEETPALQAPLVDASHALRVYRAMEEWVREGSVAKPQAAIPVTGLAGARVTLRSMGHTVAIGDCVYDAEETFSPTEPADLVAVVRSAAERAITDFNQRAAEQAKAADDPMRQPIKLTDLSALLTVDLQLAHALEPLVMRADARPDELIRQYAAGYHGLHMMPPPETGERRGVWSWPATNLAANIAPPQQIAQLMRALGFRPDMDLERIARPGGPQVQRFAVIHVTRPAPRQPVEQLIRGNVILPVAQINSRTLEGVQQRLASHLLAVQKKDGSYYGTYEPSRDEIGDTASIEETALATYALAHYVAAGDDGAWADSDADALTPTMAARRTLELLLPALTNPYEPPRAKAWALTLLTILEWPEAAAYKEQREQLRGLLLTVRGPDHLFRDGRGMNSKPLEAAGQALVLAALAQLYEQTRDEKLAEQIAESLDAAWMAYLKTPVINGLSTLAATALRMNQLGVTSRGAADPAALRKQHEERLQLVRDALAELRQGQVVEPPALGPADVLGGFDLSPIASAGAPYPDWQSVHALNVMTATLRHPELLGENDRLRLTVDCAMAARFLAQLMFDQPGCFYLRQHSLVLGGVRQSLADNTVAIAPTALTLIAITDLRQTLEALEREPENQ